MTTLPTTSRDYCPSITYCLCNWFELQDLSFLIKNLQHPSDNFQMFDFISFVSSSTRAPLPIRYRLTTGPVVHLLPDTFTRYMYNTSIHAHTVNIRYTHYTVYSTYRVQTQCEPSYLYQPDTYIGMHVFSHPLLYMCNFFTPDGAHTSKADTELNRCTSRLSWEVVPMKITDFQNLQTSGLLSKRPRDIMTDRVNLH